MDTSSEQFLDNFEKQSHLRPVVGDIIKIRNNPKPYKITRQTPTTPSENPPETINFFVKILNSSPDSLSMGGDIAKFTRAMRYLGR